MTASFEIQHSALLLKYSGISFISGAVNHGFFSGERSLLRGWGPLNDTLRAS